MKADRLEVGQKWKDNDPRGVGSVKEVVDVDGHRQATMRDVKTGRKSTVREDRFLARQGRASGYTLIHWPGSE